MCGQLAATDEEALLCRIVDAPAVPLAIPLRRPARVRHHHTAPSRGRQDSVMI